MAAISAEKGIVKTQAHTIVPASPHFTADARFIEPTPIIAPVIVCVVDTGTPIDDDTKRLIAAEVSAQKPSIGFNFATFCPIVFTILQPPNMVPREIVP